MVGDTMRVDAGVEILDPVVYAHGEPVMAGTGFEHIALWRADVTPLPNPTTVDPQFAVPMAAFHEQEDISALPFLGDDDVSLVPRPPGIV
jgi:hypothetical protein